MRVPPLYRPADVCGQASGPSSTCSHAPQANHHAQQQHPAHQMHQPQRQHQQQHCVQPPVGGQRMALKLAAPSSQQHLKSVQAHRWQQPPASHHYGPAARTASPCDGFDCEDQDSDCSCSNSLDCPLSSQPAAFQASSPRMGPAGCQLQHLSAHLMPDPLGDHHNPHQGAHPAQPFHYHSRQQQPPPPAAGHCLDRAEGCAFVEHHSFHRAHLGHTSAGSGSNSGASPPPAPPPPSLVRQSTYSTNSDTITDATLGHHRQQQPPQPQQIPLTPPPPPAMAQQHGAKSSAGGSSDLNPASERVSDHYGSMKQHGGTGGRAASGSSKQRQSVSFRRSATTATAGEYGGALAEPSGPLGKPLGDVGHQQEALKGDHSGQQQHPSTLHRQRSQPVQAGPKQAPGDGSGTQGPAQNVDRAFRQNNHTCSTGSPGTAGLSHSHSGLQQQQQQSQSMSQQQLHHHHHHHGPANLSTGYPPPGSPGSQPMRAAAVQLLAATSGASPTFDGPTPLPPISSHRTNSPWMRISSIILTPIGIVIILFIVVSPLLHYLM